MRNFYGKKLYYYIISATLLVVGLIFLFIRGVKLDITFSGGAKITYGYSGNEISTIEVEKLVKDVLKRDATPH